MLQPPSSDSASVLTTTCYVYNDGLIESINFYWTNFTINVDLAANFTLTGINVFRIVIDNETTADDAELDYPVDAYICLDYSSEVENPAPLIQSCESATRAKTHGLLSSKTLTTTETSREFLTRRKSQRMPQDGATQSEFCLEVGLQGIGR
jgi:hypothetical protein